MPRTKLHFVPLSDWLLANTMGSDLQRFHSLTMLAEIFCNQGEYAKAEQCLWEKGRIVQKFDNVFLDEPKIWGYLALLTGRLEEAEEAFQITGDIAGRTAGCWVGSRCNDDSC